MPKPSRPQKGEDIYRAAINGMAELIVLQQAQRAPVYGRELTKMFDDLGYDISPGKLYPLLRSLETQGLLRSRSQIVSGRLRKYYRITRLGESCLSGVRQALAEAVGKIVLEEGACQRAC